MKSKLPQHAAASSLFLFVVGWLLFLPAVGFTQTVSFSGTNFSAGTAPRSAALADFNGDGNLDMAVANNGSGTVSIRLGTGSGSFGAATSLTVGTAPNSVVAGDFDGDGKLDLAVANFGDFSPGSGSVSILLGNGAGTFGAATDFAIGSHPFRLAAGDFDGDGNLDIAMTKFSNTIAVILGNGDGTFGAATTFPIGHSTAIAVGDFNRDGKFDLAVTDSNNDTVSIFLGVGDGTFGAATDFDAGTTPGLIAVDDFNRDGKFDLAITSSGSDEVSILLGNGNGTFGAATSFSVGTIPRSVAVADFNGDGKLDLAVANEGDSSALPPILGSVSILLGNGAGSFGTATNFAAGGEPQFVAVGDFNRDGKPDLVVANETSNNVSVLLNTTTFTPSGNFGAATNLAIGEPRTSGAQSSVAVGDFNRDGNLDLAVASGAPGIDVLLGDGKGGFGAAAHIPMEGFSVVVGDFDGNGILDLVVANPFKSKVSILLGVGDGTFGVAADLAVGGAPESVAVGDFNGDGKLDLAVANFLSNNVSILLGNGDGSFGAVENFAVGSEPFHLAVGDFNRDGNLDLAVVNSDDDDVSILLGVGDGTFGAATNFPSGFRPGFVATGDFNGDGKLDLAVGNGAINNVSILLGAGDGSFGMPTNLHVGGLSCIVVHDFDRDGKLDLAMTRPGPENGVWDVVSVFFGAGDGSFGSSRTFGSGSGPFSAVAGDFNHDGKLDLAVVNTFSNDVSLLLNGIFNLTTNKTGSGSGTVTSNIAGINCGGDCTEDYNVGTSVTLTATAGTGFLFAGWSGGGCSGTGTCNVTMNADKTVTATFVTPLALAALLLPNGEAGVVYSAPLVTGGLGPYNFTLTKGIFPSGLSGNSANGRLAGTPSPGKAGGFTVRITDQLGSSVAGTFKIKLLPALNITTAVLKAGTNGRAYKGALKAAGGLKPYAWSLIGNLPAGLTLNSLTGAITGIPTQTGTFNLTFRVTDPAGGSAQKLLPLTIN
jgi:VCBS repeat protein/putative Ig domain-containing protein/List-Bact-rpt repeat protein/FG-GAP repeat protein